MKTLRAVFLFVVLCCTMAFLLNGCTPAPSSNAGASTEPSTDTARQAAEAMLATDYGYSCYIVDNETKTFRYTGVPVSLEVQIKNDEPVHMELGIFLFVGGIAQQYSITGLAPAAYMQTYTFAAEEDARLQLSFTPQAVPQGEQELQIITILNPSFLAWEPNYVFGNNHKASGVPVPIHIDAPTAGTIRAIDATDTGKISAAEWKKYDQGDRPNRLIGRAHTVLQQSGMDHDRTVALAQNDLQLDIRLLGGEDAGYYTTVFVNHEPVAIDGGYDVIRHTLREGYFATFPFLYKSTALSNNDIIYTISVPILRTTQRAQSIKSKTIMVLKEE